VKLRKRNVPRAACKQTVYANRRREMFEIITTRKPPPLSLKGPVTSFVPSWLRFPTELNGLAAPPLAEAKRFGKRAKNVASVGLSVQQSPSSRREVYIVHTILLQFLRKLFLTSQVVQQLYLIARRGGSPFEFSR
jgi:hypothetical protein